MRELKSITRRTFGRGMGIALTLTGLPGIVRAHGGTHEVAVKIARFKFAPKDVEVLAGDSVTWTNDDSAPHTATSDDGDWDTGKLEKGEEGRITFDAPGEFTYFCVFHPHMKGRVIVKPKPEA